MAEKLPFAPLQEVFLELKWNVPEEGEQAYPAIVGMLRARRKIAEKYPFVEKLPANQLPDNMAPQVVRFRFRREQDGHPLVQIGPGIAAINFATEYDWQTFKLSALEFRDELSGAFTDLGEVAPTWTAVRLRYFNAVHTNGLDSAEFINQRLNTRLELPAKITASEGHRLPTDVVQIKMEYPLSTPDASGVIGFYTGTFLDEPAMLWDVIVTSVQEKHKMNFDLASWLDDAHSIAESWFESLVEGQLLKDFRGGEGSD